MNDQIPTAGLNPLLASRYLQPTPWERYQQDLLREEFQHDPAQETAVKHLQRLYEDLVQRDAHLTAEFRWVSWLKSAFGQSPEPCQGLYFWGGVGRGKTYLVDTFYDSLPFERKLRTHFHRFMQQVHQQLTALKGQKNPLEQVADEFARQAIVICFDEFFVSDIGDAMILGGLMQALFARGVTLVATSNIVPEGLYKDGLQRERFIPVIKLIERHTNVVNVDNGVDYRLRVLQQAKLYHSPLTEAAHQSLEQSFINLIPDEAHVETGSVINILGRDIPCIKEADDVAWFSFDALCDGPRSQNDYIELSKLYHAVLIENVPLLDEKRNDSARRFINLIDEFYDRGVKVIMSAAEPIPTLYQGERLSFEFERTQSRLLEMQSEDYLSKEHKA
jgi:cell division protein ZapE